MNPVRKYAFIASILITPFINSQINTGGQVGADYTFIQPDFKEAPPTEEANRVVAIVKEVEDKNKFLEYLHPDSTASLPFGMIKQIGNYRYIVAIDSMKFQKAGAYFSAYAAIDFPGTTRKLAFRASHVKFNPSGVVGGEQARLYLVSDCFFKINGSTYLHLLANNKNWVEWDCNGFKNIHLTGDFIFRPNTLVPDSFIPKKDTAVHATFEIHADDINDFIATVSISPFKLTSLKDWSFSVSSAVVDMSELSNSPGMLFPSDYSNPNLGSLQMWKGFYLASAKIKLPPEISRNGQRTTIDVKHLMIDQMGVSGGFTVSPLLGINEGHLAGWNYSIDEIGVGFTCNQPTSGHIKGKVEVPIFKEDQQIQYEADAQFNVDKRELDFRFLLKPVSELRMDVFSANVVLNNNSSLTVTKVGGMYKPSLRLNGFIDFDHKKMNTNGGALSFQDLILESDAPYLKGGVFSLHTANGSQPKTTNYPISFNDITFGIKDKAPILGFNVAFNLSEDASNCITAGTSILIKGKIEESDAYYAGIEKHTGLTVKKTKWSLDKVSLAGVAVNAQSLVYTVKGVFEHKEADPLYGDGFFGKAEVRIMKVIDDPIMVSAGFGAKEDFKYFFLDLMVPEKYLIPGSKLGLSRVIGGMSYHMKPSKLTEVDYLGLAGGFNPNNPFALAYVPDKEIKLGLKAGGTGEFSISETAINGTFFLQVNFSDAGGLALIALSGNMRAMAKIADVDVPIAGRIVFAMDHVNKTFDALAQVSASVKNVLTGTGSFKFHTDPSNWYICFGRPLETNMISYLGVVNAPSYFMTGSTLEPCLAPPQSISNQYGTSFSNRNYEQIKNGAWCMGAKIVSRIDPPAIGFDFFKVKAYLDFELGCDLTMSNYGPRATYNGTRNAGINGLQAEGNMYLDFHANVNVNGHIKFPRNCPTEYEECDGNGHCVKVKVRCILDENFSIDVLSADLTALVRAKFPAPVYFAGELDCPYSILGRESGNINFHFQWGNDYAISTN